VRLARWGVRVVGFIGSSVEGYTGLRLFTK
jgi:hypothetical protein